MNPPIVLVVASPEGEIHWVDSNGYGSYHDSFILNNGRLFQKFENEGYRPFYRSVMLGDEGFPTFLDWLCTPFPRDQS